MILRVGEQRARVHIKETVFQVHDIDGRRGPQVPIARQVYCGLSGRWRPEARL